MSKSVISARRPHRDIIVVGASAGGVETLLKMTSRFPAMEASILIVVHTAPYGVSVLPDLLNRQSQHLRARPAQDGLAIEPGFIYVSVPNYHLIVEQGHMRLVHGPLENRHRPSVDALFRTAAKAYGPRVIGVVLSGYMDDGSAGLYSIKRAGGLAVVQDPKDAPVSCMPASAIATTAVDYVRPAKEIPQLLHRLVAQPIEIERTSRTAEMSHRSRDEELVDPEGSPSAYSCPECQGTLWEVEDGKLLRFACRVGHSFSIESMLQDQSDSAERAVWAALRALEERADLSRRMEKRSLERGLHHVASRYAELAVSAASDAALVRKLLLQNRPARSRERDVIAESA